jgi:hypothetical protein
MAEKTLWKYLRDGMKGRWDACRHEDRLTAGVPDVSYGLQGINGWIELKELKRSTKGQLRLPRLTIEQRRWLTYRGRKGGNCWILVRVGRDYILINGEDAFQIEELSLNQFKLWSRAIDWDELEKILSGQS